MSDEKEESLRPEWAKGLSDQEWVFVDEYLRTFHIGRAYAATKPISLKYRDQSAYRFAQRPAVRTAIEKALADRGVGRGYVVDRLVDFIDADIADLYEKDGLTLKNVHEMDAAARFAINGIEFDKFGRRSAKLSDKLAALRIFVDVLGLTKQKVEVSGPDGGPVELEIDPVEALLARSRELKKKISDSGGTVAV